MTGSNHAGYPRDVRLLCAVDYRSVFDRPEYRATSGPLLALARASGRDTCRLGVIVGKRNVSKAVQRNRVKRQIRESFRLTRHQLPHIDIVILARKGTDQFDNPSLRRKVDSLWRKLMHPTTMKKARSVGPVVSR